MASFLPNLFRHDLWEPDELRCAEVAREMVVDGHWVVPHLEGDVYPDKPPLFFWLIALFSYCFGGLNTFAIRLPSALAGIGGILIAYLFGKRLSNPPKSPLKKGDEKGVVPFDKGGEIPPSPPFVKGGKIPPSPPFVKGGNGGIWTGLIAALILLAMPCYFGMSITARMDVLLTFFVSAALYCFYLAYSGGSSWLYLLFYFLMGMGTLTKGPIGFLIPFLTILSYLLVKGEWKKLLEIRLISGFLVFMVTVAAWVVPAVIQGGRDYAYQILFHQNVDRYIGGWNHANSAAYYFKVLPVILMPWSPLLIVVFITATKERLGRGGVTPPLLFPMMWLITTFVFLSCSGSRGRIYLLPVLPAVALSIASLLGAFFASDRVVPIKRPTLISYLVMLGLIVAGAIAGLPIIKHDRPSTFTVSLPILNILGVGSIVSLVLAVCKVYRTSFIAFVATVLIASFIFCFQALPIISQDRSVRPLFAEINKIVKAGDELRTYMITGTSYSYYRGGVIKKISTEEELHRYLNGNERAFCLIKERHYEKIKQNPDSPISVVLKMRASGIRFVLVTGGASKGIGRCLQDVKEAIVRSSF